MSFFKELKSALGYTATNRLVTKEAEYQLYEKVSQEIANGEKDAGVWAAAFTKSEGDEKKADAKYIELMVQRYKDFIEAGLEFEEILKSNFEENLRRKEKEREEKEREEARFQAEIEKSRAEQNQPDAEDAPMWFSLILLTVIFFLVVLAASIDT
tara:strand:- start:74 stop:538 length:465 start_codon:yes stop_codon:yes gene_type:complete